MACNVPQSFEIQCLLSITDICLICSKQNYKIHAPKVYTLYNHLPWSMGLTSVNIIGCHSHDKVTNQLTVS